MTPIYDLAFYRCNQFPHHSLFWEGLQLPICMRDVGITIGFLVGILAIYLAKNYRSKNVDWRVLGLLVPMALDGGFQFLGVWESTFLSRYLTGILTGFVIGIVFVALLQGKIREKVPGKKSVLYFALISIPFFAGYWMMSVGYSMGLVGSLLFWVIVWSIPFIYFIIGLIVIVVAWRVFEKATDDMERLLNRRATRP